ncbi:TlpA family protein disulfide reductase [Pedobacter alpinus]|uniref:TlpA family protein disulfide reductase n=1 Tax=Pedobacter alpinus TaxID=1590643 RepID=A0ABW5TW06_9SPHI
MDGKNPAAPIFLIYELSLQEIESRRERLPKPMDSGVFKEGDDFKYFSFRDTENVKFKKEDLIGKVLVLNFWFINCPPCKAEIPEFNEIVAEYKNNEKVVFVAVGLDEWVDVKEFIKNNPYNFHLVTGGRYIADDYGVNGYPTNIVVDTTGKIAFQSKGGSMANPLWIRKAIDKSLE